MTDPGSAPNYPVDMPQDDLMAHAIFEAIETALTEIGSPEALDVRDAMVALSMDDEKTVAMAIVNAVNLNRPVDASGGDQTGARASTLRPLDREGWPPQTQVVGIADDMIPPGLRGHDRGDDPEQMA